MITKGGIIQKMDIEFLKQIIVPEETVQMYNCMGVIETPNVTITDFLMLDDIKQMGF